MIGLWMKWFFGAVLLLLMAIAFQLELLAYAMYALIAVLVLSRGFAQSWIRHLSACLLYTYPSPRDRLLASIP